MSEQSGSTALGRRAVRIAAARVVVKGDRRLGRTTHPAIVELAHAQLVLDRKGPSQRAAS